MGEPVQANTFRMLPTVAVAETDIAAVATALLPVAVPALGGDSCVFDLSVAIFSIRAFISPILFDMVCITF